MRLAIYCIVTIILFASSSSAFNLAETSQIGENVALETKGVLSMPTTTVYDLYADDQIVEQGSTLETADSDSTHPLTKDEFQFADLEEFVVLPYTPELDLAVYEDASNDFNLTQNIPVDLNRYDSGAITFEFGHGYDLALGDIDGDGYDEIMVVDRTPLLTIFDDAAHNYTSLGNYSVSDNEPFQSIATGDVDGDGIDEILHVNFEIGDYEVGLGVRTNVYLSVYKFHPTWTCLSNLTVVSGHILEDTNRYGMEPEIATGDFDGDGRDEIAVVFTFDNSSPLYQDIWVLDDYQNDFAQIWTSHIFTYLSSNNYYPTMDIDIATGDFDGDGRDEIAYSAAIRDWGYYGQLAIIDNDFTFELFDLIHAPEDLYVYKTPVAAGDLDGDGRDEVVMGTAYGGVPASGDIHIYEYLPEDDSYELNTSIGASFLDTWLDVGDVDCDGLDEIVGSGRHYTGVIDDAKHSYEVMGSNTDVGGVVRIGDLDGDGVRIKYTGESWNNTPSPGVVAVIAAPPVYDGIDQN
ncbi:MAG: VCBS repeat-containing protein, partial [Candidatus Heimdallarchaeota archaeon]|nr:VCBS repeat-containing protein [Candidatus Heimdallarchaeota archaeon]